MKRRSIFFTVFGLWAVHGAAGQELADLGEGVGLTVYNLEQNFAIVRERRTMDLPPGRSPVRFEDVAATIVPETVQFRSLRPEDSATVVEQNYEFDLVNASKLLDKYIDKPISIVTRSEDVRDGTLMSFDDAQLVLASGGGIEMIPRGENVKDIRFSALPEGLMTRPTLVWLVEAARGGEHLVQVAYRANRVHWEVDYRAVADASGDKLDLSGWVTVNNKSGKTYADARLKLMAGDVNVVEDELPMPTMMARDVRLSVVPEAAKAPGFEEKSFAEYHLYTLPRPTTIKDNQIKQIELIDVPGIPVKRKYLYRGRGNGIEVVMQFKNDEEVREGLGIPLPKGPFRVYQRDADGQVEFIGKDSIDHTPKKEEVKIRIGETFDVKGERVRLEERRPARRVREEDWRIRLRNHKDEALKVQIEESMRRGMNWEILKPSHDYEKESAFKMVFEVDVPANGETEVTYTVRYTW